jgi:hypothetical protein
MTERDVLSFFYFFIFNLDASTYHKMFITLLHRLADITYMV